MHMDTGEASTTTLIRNSFLDNKRVFLPHIVRIADDTDKQFSRQTHELQMLEVNSWQDVEGLEPRGKYRLREPVTGTNGK
jgi:5-formyltetrahydrofolate cyclo-ligase